jgi:hypothetical protein
MLSSLKEDSANTAVRLDARNQDMAGADDTLEPRNCGYIAQKQVKFFRLSIVIGRSINELLSRSMFLSVKLRSFVVAC